MVLLIDSYQIALIGRRRQQQLRPAPTRRLISLIAEQLWLDARDDLARRLELTWKEVN